MLNLKNKSTLALCTAVSLLGAANAGAQVHEGLGALFQLPDKVKPALATSSAAKSCESLLNLRASENAIVSEAQIVDDDGEHGRRCNVAIEVTLPSSPHAITVWLALPVDHWNGRFLGLGGGGWMPGFPAALGEGSSRGFATAITNSGRPYDLTVQAGELARMSANSAFLLDATGRLDWTTLQNFAYRAIHEMTVAGKAVTTQFYGTKPRYAYFSGCSTGGRQGQSEVQRFPNDYDGVLSGSPAINWAHFAAAEAWQSAVTKERRVVPQCKLDAANHAAVEACDADDGVRDGLISRSNSCHFEASRLVGMQTGCGVIENADADVIESIWDGPHRHDGSKLWYGVDRAALIHPPFVPEGPSPFGDAKLAHPDRASVADFEMQFDEFVERYGGVMDTSSPDVDAFAQRGGKTIIWHGIADDIIPAAGSVHYVESVRNALGIRASDSFLRFYLAPGVRHCGGGDGPQPVSLLQPLMAWVEQGKAPAALRSETLNDAGVIRRTRPLCPYPQTARYRGNGSLDDARNFRCTK